MRVQQASAAEEHLKCRNVALAGFLRMKGPKGLWRQVELEDHALILPLAE